MDKNWQTGSAKNLSLFAEKTVRIYQITDQETCKDIKIILHIRYSISNELCLFCRFICLTLRHGTDQMVGEHLTFEIEIYEFCEI